MTTHNNHSQSRGRGSSPGQASAPQMVPMLIAETAPSPESDGTVQLKPAHLWAAFRRRWFLAVVLGILAALPVAYLAWTNTPTPYRAEAEIKIRVNRPRVLYSIEEDRGNFDVLKQGEMKEVLHRDTVIFALEQDDLAQLPMIRQISSYTDPIDWIRENVKTRSSGKEYFTLSLEGENPEAITEIVNTLAESYIERRSLHSLQDNGNREVQLKKERDELDESIKRRESQIDDRIKRNTRSNGESDVVNGFFALFVAQSQKQIADIDLQLIELNLQRDQLRGVESDSESDAPNEIGDSEITKLIEGNPACQQRQAIIQRYDNEIEKLRAQFTGEHPDIKRLLKDREQAVVDLSETKKELDTFIRESLQKQVLGGGGLTVQQLEQKIAGLNDYKEQLLAKAEARKQDHVVDRLESISIARDQEEVDQLKKHRNNIIDQLQKIDIETGSGEQVSISLNAQVPTKRETKKQYMLTAGGGLASFGFVAACVVLLELRFMRIGSLKQLEQEFNVPVLGTIPNLPARFAGLQETSGKAAYYKHVFTESIDTTRTMLLNQQKIKPSQKIIMVTSALGGEGKSTLSCHMAISFARAGRRTLLIDGDLRSPRVHEVFQINDFPGLCEALRDETPVEKCIVPSPIPGLSLLPAGELDQFTLQLLAEDRVGKTLDELRTQFDVIIFDSAPVLPVTDSLLLLQSVDGVVLSIRKDVTRTSKVAATLSKIEMLGGNLLGAVIIGIDEVDYGYRSKYIRNYHKHVSRRNEEPEVAEAAI